MSDFKSDIDKYLNLWDQAVKEGFLDSYKPKERAATPLPSDDIYYNYLGIKDDLEANGPQVLQETKADTPNPIWPDSVGKDQDLPKPSWQVPEITEEIEKLKRKLYDAECKLNEKDGGGTKWNEKTIESPEGGKLWDQVQSLKKQVDELSNMLGLKDEPSGSMRTFEK